jgi:hypothetical protein
VQALQTPAYDSLGVKWDTWLSLFEPLGGWAKLLSDAVPLLLTLLKQAQSLLHHRVITLISATSKLLFHKLVQRYKFRHTYLLPLCLP